MLPYLTMHFPLTFRKIQPFVSKQITTNSYIRFFTSPSSTTSPVVSVSTSSMTFACTVTWVPLSPTFWDTCLYLCLSSLLQRCSVSGTWCLMINLVDWPLKLLQAIPQKTCSFVARRRPVVDSFIDVHSRTIHINDNPQLPLSSGKGRLICACESIPMNLHIHVLYIHISYFQRWYIDGNVKCFNGGHAPLGLLAIFTLAICVAIIPLSLAYITAKLHVSI